MSQRRAFFTLCGANFFIYGLNAIYNCFIPLYLDKYFDEIAVGALLSIGPVLMILSPLVWGIAADRSRRKNNVLALICGFAAVSFFILGFYQNFIWCAFFVAVFMFFSAPYGGLIDTITLEASSDCKIKYGPPRLMGTVGYGIIAIVISVLPSSNELLLFSSYAAAALVGVTFLLVSPSVAGHARKRDKTAHNKKEKDIPSDTSENTGGVQTLGELIRNRSMIIIFIIIFVMTFVFTYYSNFMPQYMTQDLNLPAWVWGLNVFVTLTIEFPFFIWFDKIMSRIGLKQLLIITSAVCAIRYFLLTAARDPVSILIIGAFTGAWITISIYCGTYYINATVAPRIRASGQSLMYALAYGAPKVFAGFGGGIMTKYLGVPFSYLLCGVMCALCIIIALFFKNSNLVKNKG